MFYLATAWSERHPAVTWSFLHSQVHAWPSPVRRVFSLSPRLAAANFVLRTARKFKRSGPLFNLSNLSPDIQIEFEKFAYPKRASTRWHAKLGCFLRAETYIANIHIHDHGMDYRRGQKSRINPSTTSYIIRVGACLRSIIPVPHNNYKIVALDFQNNWFEFIRSTIAVWYYRLVDRLT